MWDVKRTWYCFRCFLFTVMAVSLSLSVGGNTLGNVDTHCTWCHSRERSWITIIMNYNVKLNQPWVGTLVPGPCGVSTHSWVVKLAQHRTSVCKFASIGQVICTWRVHPWNKVLSTPLKVWKKNKKHTFTHIRLVHYWHSTLIIKLFCLLVIIINIIKLMS